MSEPSTAASLRLAAIIASSDDAILSKDLNGIIQTWNPAAERMFGYTADEVIGRPITIIIPEERLNEETTVLEKIRNGESVEHFETVRRRKDGTLLDISITVSPIKNPDGTVVGASKIARDITEQRRLKRELEDANRVKDEFLAMLSHELRTPLNAILGYLDMLRANAIPEDNRDRTLEIIERNAKSLEQLVSDTLDVSRIVAGKFRLNPTTFDIVGALDNAVDAVRPALTAKGLRLERSVAPNVGQMYGDPDRIQQVFWNLLTNAVKFTPPAGTISIALSRNGNTIECAVTDTGIGISPEFLPLVFQRFRQAASGSSHETGGLGLGLALVRHIVELHGGEVKAASNGPGTGSTFSLSVPVAAPQTAQLHAAASSKRQTQAGREAPSVDRAAPPPLYS